MSKWVDCRGQDTGLPLRDSFRRLRIIRILVSQEEQEKCPFFVFSLSKKIFPDPSKIKVETPTYTIRDSV